MTERYDSAYYEDLQARLRGILIATEPSLGQQGVVLVADFIDANEVGIALETLTDLLLDAGTSLDPRLYEDISALVRTMELPGEVAERLEPLVTRSDGRQR